MAENTAQELPEDQTVLFVEVRLRGRRVRRYTFTGDVVTIGRDPEADIFLDNVGVSRAHARFERSGDGFECVDLGSANGTYLNDRSVSREPMENGDVVNVGKYVLSLSIGEDRRGTQDAAVAGPDAIERTTVLTRDQVARVLASARDGAGASPTGESSERNGRRFERPAAPPAWRTRGGLVLALSAFATGALVGAAVVLLLLR